MVPPMHDTCTESQFSEAGFRRLAARALNHGPAFTATGTLAASPSDFDLNPELKAVALAREPLSPAAVLVPVVGRSELTVLLTQRTDGLPRHAGQIAFPGGRMDPDDRDAVATALREAEEEIGLEARFIEPLGFLDPYRTGTGYRIVPVVAIVREGFQLALDQREVADAFEVPLSFLMDEANHTTHTRTLGGAERRFYAMPFNERYIWGATAGILKNMHERLFAACSAS
jgi:8-oxo-dGTP pyrophosphatase MutT (NUDIX family)